METKAVYTDIISGEQVHVVCRGDGMRPVERFWTQANYRESKNKRKNCTLCKHRSFVTKCEKVGFTDSSATDIRPDYVCDHWTKVV